ncbi:hypothetical protein CEK66_07405 [Xanthomonas sp. LMG 12460]|nr:MULTISPECIES: FtsX-like permease family protein [Xanthomonas]KAB7779009.1 hypothetical protein CEK66_07405 [Xanthomonas sp. LMG 12460]
MVTFCFVFIMQSIERMTLSSGADDRHVIWIQYSDGDEDKRSPAQKLAEANTDLRTLASINDVRAVVQAQAVPLSGSASTARILPDLSKPEVGIDHVNLYPTTSNVVDAFGLTLIAGRALTQDDEVDYSIQTPPRGAALVTKSLAERLWHGNPAVGNVIHDGSGSYSATVVGVVDRAAKSSIGDLASSNDSVFFAVKPGFDYSIYVLRVTAEANISKIQAQAQQKLAALRQDRTLNRIGLLSSSIDDYFQADHQIVKSLFTMIAIMLLISAVSVGTLVSFCVHSRRRSFGIRRSLGATRGQIVKLILLENLILAIAATLLGLIIVLAGEQVTLRYFQLGGLKPLHMFLGACVVLITTLISAIAPALAFVRRNPMEAMS